MLLQNVLKITVKISFLVKKEQLFLRVPSILAFLVFKHPKLDFGNSKTKKSNIPY